MASAQHWKSSLSSSLKSTHVPTPLAPHPQLRGWQHSSASLTSMQAQVSARSGPSSICSLATRYPHRCAFTTTRHHRRSLHVCNMFTGIVQGMATIDTVERSENFSVLRIQFPEGKVKGIQIGASVAINGTCLTVTHINNDELHFDVMVETLRATNLGKLQQGSSVNFERSARVGDEIGGHNVSGHVHTTAEVVEVLDSANNRKVTFKLLDDSWMKYVLPKGYIAVNGCSLTIGEVVGSCFNVYLIPETLRVTVFGAIQVGDTVNVEIETQTQAIVDTTERVVAAYLERTGVKVPVHS